MAGVLALCLILRGGVAEPPRPVGARGQFQLTFDEEFAGTSLDLHRWSDCYPWGACRNVGNPQEAQCFTPTNRTVHDGLLDIEVVHRQVACDKGGTRGYGSALIQTSGHFAQAYGYYEARIRVPAGTGLWPAFWSLSEEQDWPPEIDAMEVFGAQQHPDHTSHALHYAPGQETSDSYRPSPRIDFSAGFHTFGVDWQADRLTWYVDGRPVFTETDAARIPRTPEYLLVDVAVNSRYPVGALPAHMLVDYVRMWKRQ